MGAEFVREPHVGTAAPPGPLFLVVLAAGAGASYSGAAGTASLGIARPS